MDIPRRRKQLKTYTRHDILCTIILIGCITRCRMALKVSEVRSVGVAPYRTVGSTHGTVGTMVTGP